MIDKNMILIKVTVDAVALTKLIQPDLVSNIPTEVNNAVDAETTEMIPT